jgi:hypothetical protein
MFNIAFRARSFELSYVIGDPEFRIRASGAAPYGETCPAAEVVIGKSMLG